MAHVLVTESNFDDIADAIRAKNGSSDTYRPGDMAEAILAIHTSDLENLTAVSNGTYLPSADKDGFGRVVVQVPVDVPFTVSEYADAIVFTGSAVSSQNDAIVLTT